MGIIQKSTSRRRFIISTLTAAGGLAIGVGIPGWAVAAPAAGTPWSGDEGVLNEINAWIVIDPDDSITLRVAKSEMGEGILTSLPMIIAEELHCDWTKVRAEYASANRSLKQGNVYQRFLTGGSSAVRGSRVYLQQAGASARVRLIEAAARRWKVPAAECEAANSQVIHKPTARTLKYGVLVGDAGKLKLDKEPAIKTPDQFTLIGKSVARLDTPVKVNGQAIFGIDVKVPDMLYATVITCPVPGGTLVSYDEKAVTAMPGVKAVVPLPVPIQNGSSAAVGDKLYGVAVVADKFWRAKRALDKLPIKWDFGDGAKTNSAQFREEYKAALKGPSANAKTEGNVEAAFAEGKVIEAIYEAPYLAHATMEPLNCTAHVQPGRVDIWMGTQGPDSTIEGAAKALGVPKETVFVHNCFLGGGFGRRAVNDEMVQAVIVSKAVGKPVKLIWSREEDMRHDRYRPQAAIGFKAAIGPDGMPTAFQATAVVGSLGRSLGGSRVENGVEGAAVEGLANLPYAIPNIKVDCVLKNTHVPVMYWRSVGSSQNAFAVEAFIDELAHAAGQDSYRFRRKLLEGKEDFLKVLDTLAEKSDWDRKLGKGQGRGIAIHEAFGTIVGEVVEVTVTNGQVKVDRVVAAVDCGHVVNPLTVAMQIESGIVYGLTAALYDEITIKDGKIEQGNFDSYRMVKLADTPKIETHLALSGGSKWGGIGEPGTPPIAPALVNAIFNATGKRVRSLPVRNIDLGAAV